MTISLMRAAEHLKVIHRLGGGGETIDLEVGRDVGVAAGTLPMGARNCRR